MFRLICEALAVGGVPGKFNSRPRAGANVSHRDSHLDHRFLSRDAAAFPALPGRERDQGRRSAVDEHAGLRHHHRKRVVVVVDPNAAGGAGARRQRAAVRRVLLRHRDRLHCLVHRRTPCAVCRIARPHRVLPQRDEHRRRYRHRAVFLLARHGRRRRRSVPRQPRHVSRRPACGATSARLPHLQAVAALQGSPDPRPDDPRQHARARPARLLPVHLRRAVLERRLLRRGRRRAQLAVRVNPERLLVGRGDDDDGRLRRHASDQPAWQARRVAVRYRRRAHHCASGSGHRVQLQLLLQPRHRGGRPAQLSRCWFRGGVRSRQQRLPRCHRQSTGRRR